MASHNRSDEATLHIPDSCREIVAAFRRGLANGQAERIESLLNKAASEDLEVLLTGLLEAEISHRLSLGQKVTVDEIVQRFPAHERMIHRQIVSLAGSADRGGQPTIVAPHEPNRKDSAFVLSGQELGADLVVGRYRLIQQIGRGSFGEVWMADDPELHRVVALKMPRSDVALDAETRRQFVAEGRKAARLTHPNIVSVYDAGQDHGTCFIVSQFVPGHNLRKRIQQGRLSVSEAVAITHKLATALHYAHQEHIVHRDVKPANVLLTENGEPLLTDFGLAKFELSEQSILSPGEIAGTPAYMSPEQALVGEHKVDARADVFSLGVVLNEMLTGVRPKVGSSAEDLRRYHTSGLGMPLPSEISRDVPKQLDEIFSRATSPDPAARYATAAEMADALAELQADLRDSVGPFPKATDGPLPRRKLLTTMVVAMVAILAAGAIQKSWSRTNFVDDGRVTVRMMTHPEGAQVTFIPLQSDTGFPQPANAVSAEIVEEPEGAETVGILDRPESHDKAAPGVETGKMQSVANARLRPGEYLVVVVWAKDNFHEVYRTVPAPDAESTGSSFFHTFSRRYIDDVVRLPTVNTPSPDMLKRLLKLTQVPDTTVTVRVGPSFEAQYQVSEFKMTSTQFNWPQFQSLCAINAFATQPSNATTLPAFLRGNSQVLERVTSGESPLVCVSWNEAMQYAEIAGLRLPSELELQAAFLEWTAAADESAMDLGSGPGDWTVNRAVAAPAPLPPRKPGQGAAVVSIPAGRVSLSGPREGQSVDTGSQNILVRTIMDRRDGSSPNIGIRLAKSTHPRLKPEDFPVAKFPETKTDQ